MRTYKDKGVSKETVVVLITNILGFETCSLSNSHFTIVETMFQQPVTAWK
jgi:hypothetical protein